MNNQFFNILPKMKLILTIAGVFFYVLLFAQKSNPDISKINNNSVWKIFNREIKVTTENGENIASFNARQGDGLAVFQNLEFENGTIEFDVKGKDVLQRSFVGVAFHIQDENDFNAIYFRPFNFKKPERAGHSVQYISHPEFTWQKLRSDFPEQYEHPVNPVPNPDDWFHAKIDVNWPTVKVYVEYSTESSLEVKMKSTFKKGKVGFWVGNGSDGSFKNLIVKMK